MPEVSVKGAARPFVKWAGGKTSLLNEITKRLPDRISCYCEPFAGGGAAYFAFHDRCETAFLADTNRDLMVTYRVVRDSPYKLIEKLREHAQSHTNDPGYYYKVRDNHGSGGRIERAARLIYLNKTCFNGLYRVNSKGGFNVPKGDYKKPDICNETRIWAASRALGKAAFRTHPFGQLSGYKGGIRPGDFIYADPPYDGTFTNYQPSGFRESLQEHLRNCALKWHEAGAKVLISNSNTRMIRQLYCEKPWAIAEVEAPRPINRDGRGRNKVRELMIMSWREQ